MKNKVKFFYTLFLIILTILIAVNVVYAWFSRTGLNNNAQTSPGFYIEQARYMLHDNYTLVTSYVDLKGKNNLVATGIDNVISLEELPQLLPGRKLEFNTEIINNSTSAMNVKMYLGGIQVGTGIAEKTIIGASSPSTFSYQLNDFGNEINGYFSKHSLEIANNITIAPGKKASVKWYIYISPDIDYGSFPALAENGQIITEQDADGNKYYYCVTDIDANTQEILRATLCNKEGDLVDENYHKIGFNARVDYSFPTDKTNYSIEDITYIELPDNAPANTAIDIIIDNVFIKVS